MTRALILSACVALLYACPGGGSGNGGDGDGDAGSSGGGAGFSGGFAGASGASGVGGGGNMCSAFTPCGGSIEGMWTVQDICIENAADLAGMAIDDPACSNLFVSAQTGGSGTMTFQAGTASSTALLTMELHVVWTLPCLRAASGVQTVDLAPTCANIDQNYADNPEFTSGSCMVVGQTCDCVVTAEQDFALGDSYTVQGSQITFAGDPSRTNFCVSGSMLQLGSMDGEATGTVTLTR
jgi:hypothetical protein